jgi:hypothetical protein|tara:strand:- start:425 stop:1357 length:933 start_codon:yes stop_codon:yes gene_type:complete
MFWKNDWLTYGYDGDFNQKVKLTPTSKWDVKIKKTITRPVKTYHEELLLNARAITERFPGPFDLMLSGGVDSELVLYCHKKLKLPINIFVAKYADGLNQLDFHEAMETCRIYDVKPTIIDIDLKKFFESGEAYDYYTKSYCAAPGHLPHMKIIDCLDNMPIMADGMHVDNFRTNKKRLWQFTLPEKYFAHTVRCHNDNRPLIHKWTDYSPELTMSILNLNLHKWKKHKLMSPPIDFKSETVANYLNELKYIINNLHVGTRIRPKLVGFERDNSTSEKVPPFMLEFQEQYMSSNASWTTQIWTPEQFKALL